MSDTNNPFYTNEWIQYYQENTANSAADLVAVSGGTMFEHGTTGFMTNNVSSTSTITGGGGGGGHSSSGSPLGSPLKPIRRRSRASKRTPVTLLNASATNFRALVQQFTGCPQANSGSLGRQKGPVNLSFERNDYGGLTERDKSTYPFYDQQGINHTTTLPQQPQGSISDPARSNMQSQNLFVEGGSSQENGFIDESLLNGRINNGGYYF